LDFEFVLRTAQSQDKSLNIFIVDFQPDGYIPLGKSTFPADDDHGILISSYTVPGFSTDENHSSYNKGMTLVHEVGHYLGLYHVFNMNEKLWKSNGSPENCNEENLWNGCDELGFFNGDLIDDTPSQMYCMYNYCFTSSGTVIFKSCEGDSNCLNCPSEKRRLKFNNIMDYIDDECMTEFTDGQIEYMKSQTNEYRRHFVKEKSNAYLYQSLIREISNPKSNIYRWGK
jgi:hypothetical protein